MYHRLTRIGEKIVLERDEGSHSCGESRYDWRTVASWGIKDFLKQVLKLTTSKYYSLVLGELRE